MFIPNIDLLNHSKAGKHTGGQRHGWGGKGWENRVEGEGTQTLHT